MQKIKNGSLSRIILIASSCLLFTRCTFFLPNIAINKNKRMQRTSPVLSVKPLYPKNSKAKVRITKTNGDTLEGDFIGLFRQDEDDYKKLYEDFGNTPVKIVLPAIGDSIFVVLNSGRSLACFFDGFDFYQICIKSKSGKRKNLDIAEVKKVVWKNDKIPHYGLEQLFKLENPRLPLYSYIALENDDIPMAISLNELESVEKINPKSNIFAWGVLGLYVDLICVGAYIVYLFRDFGKMN